LNRSAERIRLEQALALAPGTWPWLNRQTFVLFDFHYSKPLTGLAYVKKQKE
jgi:hypothetical protein